MGGAFGSVAGAGRSALCVFELSRRKCQAGDRKMVIIVRGKWGLSLVTLLLLSSIVFGAETKPKYDVSKIYPFWPQFHGPGRDNISVEKGLLKRWPDGGPSLVRTAKGIGHGFSTVSIADNRIFTAGNIDGRTVITAMDMDGKILWQSDGGKAWQKPSPHPGTRGTPTIDGDYVYYESPHGQVVCLKAETGEKVWTRNILKDFSSENIKWGLSESLLIDGPRVIVCPGGSDTAMAALDKTTGKTRWKAPATPDGDLAGYASPILVEHEGLRLIVTLTAKAIIGVDADTGELLFRVDHESYADENVLTPLFRDGCIFISTIKAGSVKWKLNVDGKTASLSEVWRSKELDSHHDAIILAGGYLYGSSRIYNQKLWVCLDWKTGHKRYAEKGVGRGSVTYAGGMLYTLSEEGQMGLVGANPKHHRVISQFKVPRQGEGPNWDRYWAHPVVCDGRLYLRHSDNLYVYDVRMRE